MLLMSHTKVVYVNQTLKATIDNPYKEMLLQCIILNTYPLPTMLSNKDFIILLLLIAVSGLSLRLIHYQAIPPFTETADEMIYPWYGMSLIKTGTPTSWSNFRTYRSSQKVIFWGEKYRLVSPYLDKPPLYPIITGSIILAAGIDNFPEVRLSILRLIPITLSLLSIILTGLLARSLFGKSVGLLSAILYATIPTIVLSNRLSLTENLLTPIALFAIYLFIRQEKTNTGASTAIILGALSGLAMLTKQIGLVLPLVISGIFLTQNKWKLAALVCSISFLVFSVYPLMITYYGWGFFLELMKEFSSYHTKGLPEITYTILRLPLIGHSGGSFPDGAILAGYILLFSSPFWLFKKSHSLKQLLNLKLFLGFPILYVVILGLMESGHRSSYFFGWHVYPLFPFLAILLAKTMLDLWRKPLLLKALIYFLVIGFSTIGFLLKLLPRYQHLWQIILALPLIIISLSFLHNRTSQRTILTINLTLFITMNILVVLFAPYFYSNQLQPS